MPPKDNPEQDLDQASAASSGAGKQRHRSSTFTRPTQPPQLKQSNSFYQSGSQHGAAAAAAGSEAGDDVTTLSGHSQQQQRKEGAESWGRGIRNDVSHTLAKFWWSEMKNFNSKTVAVSFFLFIAVIAPSITFGAVYAKRTNNYIGAVELLLATAWCGIFYSLVSGMPMMINGGTGPVLTFQAVTFELSKNLDVPFLTFNAWIGLWVALYMLLSGFFDLNRFIKYATRFTDEIFAFLIISIFILDAIGNPASQVGLFHYFDPDHKHHSDREEALIEGNQNPEDYDFLTVAFLSLILGFGTCGFALMLRGIKHSPYFCNDRIRSAFTDFAITISVVAFTLIKELLFKGVQTEELNVPNKFAPTFNCCDESCRNYFPDDCPDQTAAFGRRSWLVDLFDLNGKAWVIVLAAGPAALAFILAFLDNGITWHIINHPSNKLSHGEAYNYDTCISALMIAANSIVGLPWLVASTVPCMMHVSAMSEISKDGEVLSVQESRLTGFFTHVLVLASLLALSTIKLIPLPVLYGVFLFMGVVALPAQQFWQRILLFFMQPEKYPETPYSMFMEKGRVHFYTIIQIFFFVVLYIVKTIKSIAIVFPFFILLCIPVRIYLLPRIFAQFELIVLDGSPEEVENFVEWVVEATQDETEKMLEKGELENDDDDNDDDDDQAAGRQDDDVKSDAGDKSSDEDKKNDSQHPVTANDNNDQERTEEDDEEEDGDQPGPPLVNHHLPKPMQEVVLNSEHAYTSEMFDAAARRSGRRRTKTVSDMSGMLFRRPPQETNWSHV